MIVAADRRIAALDMRRQGMTYRQIAQALGLANPGNAHRMVSDELALIRERYRETSAEMFQLELERLDLLWQALMPAVEAGNTRAAMACVAISKRRCALLGLDKTHPVERPIGKSYIVLDASPNRPAMPENGYEGRSAPATN